MKKKLTVLTVTMTALITATSAFAAAGKPNLLLLDRIRTYTMWFFGF